MEGIPYLFGTGVFLGTAVFLLVRRTLPAFKIIGAGAVLLSYISFVSMLIISGKILDWPHLFRTQSPIQYLVGPIGLWTALWLMRPELKWSKIQYVHFLPFLLHALELLPFYALSAEEKVALYMEYIQGGYDGKGYGMFSYQFHAVCKSMHLLGYTLVWAYLLRTAVTRSINRPFRPLLVWIGMDVVMKVLATGALFISNFQGEQGFRYLVFSSTLFLSDALFSALFLLVYPKMTVEPLALPILDSNTGDEENVEAVIVLSAEAVRWANQVDAVLERHYRDPGLDADRIAGYLFVSRRHLHRICKQHTIGTPMERLLELRLRKGREQILADPAKPLGSIALEVGFSYHGPFALHFKNKYGMLPSEFQEQCRRS